MILKTLISIIFIFVITIAIEGSELSNPTKQKFSLSLNKCIKKALDANPQLELIQNDISVANILKTRVKHSRFLPKLELENSTSLAPNAMLGPNGFADDNTKNDWNDLGIINKTKITFVQPIFTFGKIKNSLLAADELIKLNKNNLHYKKQEIVSIVSSLYYTLVFIKEVYSLIEYGNNSLNKAISKIEKQFKKNKKTKNKESDLFQLKMFQLRLDNKEVEVRTLNSKTLQILKKLMKLQDNTSFNTEDNFLDPLEKQIQTESYYLTKLNNNHLLISQLDHAINAQKHQLEISKSDYYPQFFFTGQIEYATTPHRKDTDNPFLNDQFNQTQGALFLGFKLPLSFHLTSINIQEKKIKLSRLKIQKKMSFDMISLKIKEQFLKVNMAKKTMTNNEKLKILTKKWLNSELITFNLGGTNEEDLLKALKSYLESSATFLESILNFNQKLLKLEFISSTDIEG